MGLGLGLKGGLGEGPILLWNLTLVLGQKELVIRAHSPRPS